jgi:hypothetical protein
MRTPEQTKWDFVQEWLKKAQQDVRAAQMILAGDFEDYGNVGFHAQQAAERSWPTSSLTWMRVGLLPAAPRGGNDGSHVPPLA